MTPEICLCFVARSFVEPEQCVETRDFVLEGEALLGIAAAFLRVTSRFRGREGFIMAFTLCDFFQTLEAIPHRRSQA